MKTSENRKYIKIRGANEHNLKNIDVDIPRDEFVVLTGLRSPVFLRIRDHAAELVNFKFFHVSGTADLPVNHTAAVLALNADCNNQKQWRKNHQKQHRKDEVKASFYRTLGNFHSKMVTEKDR